VYENLFSIISLHERVRPIYNSTFAAISDYFSIQMFHNEISLQIHKRTS